MTQLLVTTRQVLGRFASSVKNGFAFVELIVLAAIFSVVIGFAVPRFVTLDEQARSAALTDFGHELRMTAALVHSVWLSQGQPEHVEFQGKLVDLDFGYPNLESIADVLASDGRFTYDPATGVFLPQGRIAVRLSCMVTYSAPTASGEAPAVKIEKSGC